jgi:hypothetical protein
LLLFSFLGCTIAELDLPHKNAGQQPLNFDEPSNTSIVEGMANSTCCNCTVTVTNTSDRYTTVVALSPDQGGCGALSLQKALSPNSSETKSGLVDPVGNDGAFNIFYLYAFNLGDERAQADCVTLRIAINCGGSIYNKNIMTERHDFDTEQYYVAQFSLDNEGQPGCGLVPLDLSYRCRTNPPLGCLPRCYFDAPGY